ncbi:MAG: hypothetical protein AABW67_03440 [Nanoarchaeota archaeon]
MKFILKKKPTSFLERFKIKKKATITSRETLLSKLGFTREYTSKIKTDVEISDTGDLEKFINSLADAGHTNPLGIPREILEGYYLIITGRLKEFLNEKIFLEELSRAYHKLKNINERELDYDMRYLKNLGQQIEDSEENIPLIKRSYDGYCLITLVGDTKKYSIFFE